MATTPSSTSKPEAKTGARALKTLGRRVPVHEAVQEEIKRYIAENSLRPGDQLPPEGELAKRLEVGRNSVREAVKSLEAVGIIEVRVGSGLFVRELTFDTVTNYLAFATLQDFAQLASLREMRELVDIGAVDLMIDRLDEEQIDRLTRVLDEWRPVSAKGEYRAAFDREFHDACLHHLNNEMLAKIIGTFWDVQEDAVTRGSLVHTRHTKAHFRLHEEIAASLIAKDRSALVEAIRAHYRYVTGREDRLRLTSQGQRSD